MRVLCVICVMALSVVVAQAQQPSPPTPPKFVPFTIEEQDAKNLRAYLDDQPLKLGLPILQWLEMLENRAKATAEAKAAEEAKAKAKDAGLPKPEEKPGK